MHASDYAPPIGAPSLLSADILARLRPDRARQCPACEVWHTHGVIYGYSLPERPDVVLWSRFCAPCAHLVDAGRGGELLEAAADALRCFVPGGWR